LRTPAESTPGDLLILRCRVRAPGDPRSTVDQPPRPVSRIVARSPVTEAK
jgi:hypothetical protein